MLTNASAINRAALVALFSFALAACGGGGGNGGAVAASNPGDSSGPLPSSESAVDDNRSTPDSALASLTTSGLVLHLETDQGVVSSAGLVSDWLDQSAGNNSVTSVGGPALVENVLNGFPVISLDGNSARLERFFDVNLPQGSADRTVLMLANYGHLGTGGIDYGSNSCNAGFQLGVNSAGQARVAGTCPANEALTDRNLSNMEWVIHSAALESSVLTQRLDGEVISTTQQRFETASANLQRLVIGGDIANDDFVEVSLAAVFIWNRALSEAEIASTSAYLESKYLAGAPAEASDSINQPAPVATNPDPVATDTPAPSQPEPSESEGSSPSQPTLPSQPPVQPEPEPEPSISPEPPAAEPVPEPSTQETPAPIAQPTASLSSSNLTGGGVVLEWTSSNADSCSASGRWNNESLELQGSRQRATARIGETYRLTCSNAAGSAVSMVTIVDKTIEVSWQVPSDTGDVDNYGIHYGDNPSELTELVEADPRAGSQAITVEGGALFIAFSARARNGDSSSLSPVLELFVD